MRKVENRRWKKQKSNVNSTISITTLNVNRLNTSNKIQRLKNGLQSKIQQTHFKYKDKK